ncbi:MULTISPECIES: hypothetical protein [unclassified Micromonospora]|uniref:hypothetical protein n=1 Tax=unclassified Micromonospora TaxID=2617518 RepID=UPI001E4DA2EB|nr:MULTISPECIES: hypothetical protein [unclassified Micromonospora]WBC05359.1 hypothetical protein O7546_10505 [Micromonospora sp. WMMA1976]
MSSFGKFLHSLRGFRPTGCSATQPGRTGRGSILKIVVIGGSGLIGSKLVKILGGQGHEAVPASPKTGVNTLNGEGVADVLSRADAVVDVSNSPSLESGAAL